MDLIIRETILADIPEICDIIREVHPKFIAEELAKGTQRDLLEGNHVKELALTAMIQRSIVGYIYFVEQDILCDGQYLRGLELYIMSVRKSFQRQGIGSALITRAHEVATSLGYDASIVNGWEEYYPRFGYRAMFGAPHLCISRKSIDTTPRNLLTRSLLEQDIPHLRRMWNDGNYNVSLAVAPPSRIASWRKNEVLVFHTPHGISAIQGFIVCSNNKKDIYAFESVNKNTTLEMLAYLASAGFIDKDEYIDLPLHPSHRISEELSDIAQKRSIEKKDFLMACNLSSTKLDDIYKKVQNNQNSLGTFWTPRDPWIN